MSWCANRFSREWALIILLCGAFRAWRVQDRLHTFIHITTINFQVSYSVCINYCALTCDCFELLEEKMNDAVNLTSRSFLTISVPYWQPASPLTWFMTWVQPGIALFGVVLNAIVVLIIGLVPGRRLAEVTRASRVYYVVISSAELVSLVVGYLCRQSIPIASLLVCNTESIKRWLSKCSRIYNFALK